MRNFKSILNIKVWNHILKLALHRNKNVFLFAFLLREWGSRVGGCPIDFWNEKKNFYMRFFFFFWYENFFGDAITAYTRYLSTQKREFKEGKNVGKKTASGWLIFLSAKNCKSWDMTKFNRQILMVTQTRVNPPKCTS